MSLDAFAVSREMCKFAVETVYLTALLRLYPFRFPIGSQMGSVLIDMLPSISQFVRHLSNATGNVVDKQVLVRAIEFLNAASADTKTYSAENVNMLLIVYTNGIDSDLTNAGIVDYLVQYPDYARHVIPHVLEKTIHALLWWLSGAKAALPISFDESPLLDIQMLGSSVNDMTANILGALYSQREVCDTIQRWLELDTVRHQVKIGSDRAAWIRAVSAIVAAVPR